MNKAPSGFTQFLQNKIENFRHKLAYIDALPQLSLLGLVSGILAALVVIAFRLAIQGPLSFGLTGNSDNFEGLPTVWRFVLPFAGALLIGVGLHAVSPQSRRISVSHVLDRLHNHQGHLPAKNFFVQFVAGVAALLTGQSVGREGPAVHLGAAAASQLGQWLRLPNNSMQTLVGCGVAAAIAASFNTPVAGVIFAMEVILMEYTITGFLPIMVAAVTGTAISHWVFGAESSFVLHTEPANRLLELPFWLFSGLFIGAVATVYSRLQLFCLRVQHLNIIARMSLAGLLTGLIAMVVPQIMGLGYDTVAAVMIGSIPFTFLLWIIAAKILVTSVGIGLGMPGGLIGPVLVIGACVGGALGLTANAITPDASSHVSLYVVIGMSAMMGAVLNAPLAALMAVLELTYNPAAMFPSLLVIVVSCLFTRSLFGHDGIFHCQLAAAGTPIKADPAQQTLNRIGVRSAMQTGFQISKTQILNSEAQTLLASHPLWIVIAIERNDGRPEYSLLRAASLANYLNREETETEENTTEAINLLEIPGQRHELQGISQRANLFQAFQQMKAENLQALYVEADDSKFYESAEPSARLLGVLTRDTVENYYTLN